MGNAHKTTQDRVRATGKRKFLGTDDPALLTALVMLLERARTCNELEGIVKGTGASDMVAALRCLGLELPCEPVPGFGRDGSVVVRDIYSATNADRRAVKTWKSAYVADHRTMQQGELFEDDVGSNDSPPDHMPGSSACVSFTPEHDSMVGSAQ